MTLASALKSGNAGRAAVPLSLRSETAPGYVCPMPIEPRWAARTQLLRELWEGRDRIIIDPALERLLASAGVGARRRNDACAEVAYALLSGGGRVRLLAEDPRSLPGARRYAGLEVADADASAAILDSAPWQVALVDLGRYLGADASPSRMLRRDLPGLARRLDRRAIALLDVLADGAAQGRVVIVTVSASEVKVAEFQALIEACFERAHLLGIAPLPVMAAVDFGVVARDDDGRGGDGEVGIAFDNSLGTDPKFLEYVAVVGQQLAGGLTLFEIPQPAKATRNNRQGADTLRIQMSQARRQLELAAAARESLVEQLDSAQSRARALEERAAALEARLAETAWGPGEAGREDAPVEARSHAALQALVTSLRWQLEKSEDQRDRLAERPVGVLEAEVASLRAQLEEASGGDPGRGQAAAIGSEGSGGLTVVGIERAQAAVDILLRRLDRGGIGQRELRRKLNEVASLLAGGSAGA